MAGGTSSTLALDEAVLDMDGNTYRCVVSKTGYETNTSGTFTLTVQEHREPGDGGDNTILYVGIGIAAAVTIGILAYFFLIRRV